MKKCFASLILVMLLIFISGCTDNPSAEKSENVTKMSDTASTEQPPDVQGIYNSIKLKQEEFNKHLETTLEISQKSEEDINKLKDEIKRITLEIQEANKKDAIKD